MERKERGINQKIFLIETCEVKDPNKREYAVMGTSGNVYNVSIENKPTCTCPDYVQRQKRCKHIYFVLIRIMKVTNEDKSKYSNQELQSMFNNIPNITKNLMVNRKLKDQYESLKITNETQQKDIDDEDDCPICLEPLKSYDVVYCKLSCGKSIHKVCFSMWTKNKSPPTCVYCRNIWVTTISPANSGTTPFYVNLKK